MVGSTARKEVRLFSGCERPRCRFIRCGEREQDLALHGAAMAASEIIKHESEAAPPWTLFACDRRLPLGSRPPIALAVVALGLTQPTRVPRAGRLRGKGGCEQAGIVQSERRRAPSLFVACDFQSRTLRPC
jgi:hypothetical protein